MENRASSINAVTKDLCERDPKTYAIIGAAIDVHQQLGCGFLESVYQEALAIELGLRQIPFRREVQLPIMYKGQVLVTSFCADFICFDSVIVELKALAHLSGHRGSTIDQLFESTGHKVGLLLNFGTRSLVHRRLVF